MANTCTATEAGVMAKKEFMNKKRILNIEDLEYSSHSHGESFEAEFAPVANNLNAKKLGYRVTRVPAGKRAWPLHAHYVNEEMFFVLSGNGSVKIGKEIYPIKEGDFISAPPNPEEPHQIINDSGSSLTYICVSTMLEPEVAVYPDSEKIGVVAGSPPGRVDNKAGIFKFVKMDSDVGYWDGEE